MIGIHTPYTWTESTWMAIGLANYISKLGLTPSIFPFQSHDTIVCTDWDSKVVARSKADFPRWCKKCSHIIWLGGINKARAEDARARGVINVLLVSIHDIDKYSPDILDLFDFILTPSVCMSEILSNVYPDHPIMPIPWDPAIPIINKKITGNGVTWVYVPIQSSAAARFGSRIIYSLSLLIDKHPNINITVVRNKRWTRLALKELYELRRKNPLRVGVQIKPTVQERLAAYSTHDWTFYPYYVDDHCFTPLESLYSGTPVITFHSFFTREVVKSGHNGLVIRTAPETYLEGFRVAMNPSPADLTDMLLSAVPNRKLLRSLMEKPWPDLESRRRTFQAAWAMVLD